MYRSPTTVGPTFIVHYALISVIAGTFQICGWDVCTVSARSKQQADLREASLMGHTLTRCAWQYLTETPCVLFFSFLDFFPCPLCVSVVRAHVCLCLSLPLSFSAQQVHTHTHPPVGPGTGRQLNRSAWGNLDRPAGGGRHAAGGNRTGENSNTSDGHALCFTGRQWGTHTHKCTHTDTCIQPAGQRDD